MGDITSHCGLRLLQLGDISGVFGNFTLFIGDFEIIHRLHMCLKPGKSFLDTICWSPYVLDKDVCVPVGQHCVF